jgi:hypothetical protein
MTRAYLVRAVGLAFVVLMARCQVRVAAAELKVTTEYVYPTAFQVQGGNIQQWNNGGPGVVQESVVVPTEFATREVGVIFSVEATVSSMGHDGTAITSLEPRNKNGNTELMIAAAQGNEAAVRNRLGHGAMVNVKNNFGSTALMGAAAGGYESIVQMLLAKSAVPDSKSRQGSTALMFAARNGHAAVVNLLLAAGANVNASDNEGITALMQAVNGGYPDIVEILVKRGAKPGQTDKRGTSSIALASNRNDKNVLVMLTRVPAAK